MNPVIARAIVTRLCIFILPFVLLFGIAWVLDHGTEVGLIGFIFMGSFAVAGVFASVFGDRRMMLRADLADPPWAGEGAANTQVTARCQSERALQLATRTVNTEGGHACEAIDGHTVTGWTGSYLMTPTAYQLAVVITSLPDGDVEFTCCARPRFTFIWGGFSARGFQSQRRADSLKSTLEGYLAPR